MENKLTQRFKRAWNVFTGGEEEIYSYKDIGISSYYRPDRIQLSRGNEKSIVTAIYNKIALDVSTIKITHSKIDDEGQFLEKIKSGLDYCLNTEANIDQTGRSFKQDIIMSMFDEGSVAIVPVDYKCNRKNPNELKIQTMRVGKILQWYPNHVRVSIYNEITGQRQEVTIKKQYIGIVENPLYAIMNEPNSILKRLIRKLNLLDTIDEQSGSGKLDLIIQLPYVIKSDARKKQAEDRRSDIEKQLRDSKYGIAYTDGTEKITQLNRPVENNLMRQIEYLTSMLYSQLGITEEILNGTANEKAMTNYMNRCIEPIVSAIVDEMNRKFISKKHRENGEALLFQMDPFKLVPVSEIAEIADKLTRNEIMTSNELRQRIGMKPSKDPNADVLRNKNLNPVKVEDSVSNEQEENQNG